MNLDEGRFSLAEFGDPIFVRFKWTAEDLIAARRWHFKHCCRPPFRWAVHVVLALIMAISLFSIIRVGPSTTPICFLIAGFYFYFIRPVEIPWQTRRQFAKRPDYDLDIQWTISSERIITESAHARSEFQWVALSKVLMTPAGFLFYPTDQIFHYLPKRGFRDDQDFAHLVVLVKNFAPKFFSVA